MILKILLICAIGAVVLFFIGAILVLLLMLLAGAGLVSIGAKRSGAKSKRKFLLLVIIGLIFTITSLFVFYPIVKEGGTILKNSSNKKEKWKNDDVVFTNEVEYDVVEKIISLSKSGNKKELKKMFSNNIINSNAGLDKEIDDYLKGFKKKIYDYKIDTGFGFASFAKTQSLHSKGKLFSYSDDEDFFYEIEYVYRGDDDKLGLNKFYLYSEEEYAKNSLESNQNFIDAKLGDNKNITTISIDNKFYNYENEGNISLSEVVNFVNQETSFDDFKEKFGTPLIEGDDEIFYKTDDNKILSFFKGSENVNLKVCKSENNKDYGCEYLVIT